MPRVAIDYSKTVIYRISHKEIAGLDYVGSTTDFTRRKAGHKFNCDNSKSKKHHLKVYQVIRDNCGWDSFHMLEIKKFPCGDRREAEQEEEKCRQELKATLNMNRAFITEDEKKEYKKEYSEQHKDQIAEKNKEYREQHKNQISENGKQYYEQHKERKARTYTCECCQYSLTIEKKKRHEQSERHIKNAQNA